jgi:hypothetical protein
MPVDTVRSSDHRRSRSLGWLAVRWIEHFCVHGPGDIQGTPLRGKVAIPLSTELAALTVDAYAIGEAGQRLYDSVFFSRPKGADKSGHASRIGIFEAMGPCRFAGWAKGGEVFEWMGFRYVYEPGEPMGRRITYPFLRILATEEGQTGNVYDAIHYNLTEGPLSEAFPRKDDVGLTRIYLPGGGEIRPSTASSSAKDGGKETWVNFDETHLYVLPELRRMYATVRRNLAKRKGAEPWSFETSTMYEPGMDSTAERTHQLVQQIKKGGAESERLLFDHRQAAEDINLDDQEAVHKGLVEAYGDASTYMHLPRLIAEIRDPRNDIQDSCRYFLNQATAGAQVWLPRSEWDARANREYTVPDGALITLGFDGSQSDDATALVATEVETGFQWPIDIWERPENVHDWEVPTGDVDDAVEYAMTAFSVWRMYADPRYWETGVAKWQGRYGDKKVQAWPTNRPRHMAYALLGYRNAITTGDLSHDGDERMAQHVANATRRRERFTDEFGNPMVTIRKEAKGSPRKMDGAMAGCLSWEARTDAVAAGVTNEPARSGPGIWF